jgi:hypothetical protein
MLRVWWVVLVTAGFASCAGCHAPSLVQVPVVDAGELDAGAQADAGALDAGLPDAGTVDAGVADAGPLDAGLPDAGAVDAGVPDAGPLDAGLPDAGTVDAGVADAGVLDAGVLDAGLPDAGAPDASVPFDAGWARTFGATGEVDSVAADDQGHVYVAGFSADAVVDLGGGALSCPHTTWAPYVAWYDTDGGYLFGRCFSGWSSNTPGSGTLHVVVDSADEVTLGGLTQGPVDWGLGAPTAVSPGFFAMLTHYAADGTARWGFDFGGTAVLTALRALQGGDLLVGLSFSTVTLDQTYVSQGDVALALARLSKADGHVVWARIFDHVGSEERISALALAENGDVLVTGSFTGTLTSGLTVLTAPGPDDPNHGDAFLARFTPDGTQRWLRQLGSNAAFLGSVTALPGDGFAASGRCSDTVACDAVSLPGCSGVFVVEGDATGALTTGFGHVSGLREPRVGTGADGGLLLATTDQSGKGGLVERYLAGASTPVESARSGGDLIDFVVDRSQGEAWLLVGDNGRTLKGVTPMPPGGNPFVFRWVR